MPSETLVETAGFGGGVNLRDAPHNQLQADEVVDIRDMLLDERGAATKRLGSLLKGTAVAGGSKILSMYTFYRSASGPQIIVHCSDGSLRYTTDFATFTSIATGLSTTAPFAYETFNSKVYMTNGVDNYCSWTGAAFATYPTLPKGKTICLWKDTMWVANVSGNPDRVYSSNAGDAETFGALAFVDIAKGDGDEVKALTTNGQVLVVFKQRRTFALYDPVAFTNQLVDGAKGCEGHFCPIAFEDQIFFLCNQGIAVFLGDQPSPIISDRIGPVFSPNVLNYNLLSTSYAFRTLDFVAWSVQEITGVEVQICTYPRLPKQPFTFLRIPGHAFASVRSGTTEKLYHGAAAGSTKFYEAFNAATDDGATIQGLIETGWIDFGIRNNRKYLRFLKALARGRFFVGVKKDFEPGDGTLFTVDVETGEIDLWSTGDTWGVGLWSGLITNLKEVEFHPDIYGRHFAFKFLDAETVTGTKPFNIGGETYNLTVGEWSVFTLLAHAVVLGDRVR